MKCVAILGGGPAGAIAAAKLASAGLRTIVIDEKLAWEKPCGGGLTWKAYSQYPFLIDNDTPKKVVTETYLSAPKAGAAKMNLSRALLIYSRYDLNRLLLGRAERAGAEIEKDRVLEMNRVSAGWKIRMRRTTLDADYCIVATGARNSLKDVGTEWRAEDAMYALGYWVPENRNHIDIQFLPRLEGYIWVFPRCGHLSVGICGKGEPASALRQRLERYMEEKGISRKNGTFYGHMLPALETPSWKHNRVAGDGWLAAGDAAGLVDPITGEGLYYAIRSGDLASRIVLDDAYCPAAKEHAYRTLIAKDFGNDLALGACIAKRVFLGSFLLQSVPARMVQFMRRSPRFQDLMQDLFAGSQSYGDLKLRLLKNLNGTLHEIVMNFFFGRLIPNENRT